MNWLQVSVTVAIAQITRPADLTLDWISDASVSSTHPLPGYHLLRMYQASQERGSHYVSLMRSVYQLANASVSRVPVVATTLLQVLFTTLKDDALAFLAGMWSVVADPEFEQSRDISFLHAAAFLEAHIQEADGVDFQTILPSLLVALQNSEAQSSQGASECLSRIHILVNAKLSSVYRFDTVYGQNGRTSTLLNVNSMIGLTRVYMNRHTSISGSRRLETLP